MAAKKTDKATVESVVDPVNTATPEQDPNQVVVNVADLTALVEKVKNLEAQVAKTTTKPPRRKLNNDAVRNFARAYGDVTHEDGFKPVPPEHIVQMGERAVQAWHEKWESGKVAGRFNDDIEALAAEASGHDAGGILVTQ